MYFLYRTNHIFVNGDRDRTIGAGTLPEMIEMVRAGFNSRWGNFAAEGIVAHPAVALNDRMGHRIITKLKCKDFNHGSTK